MSVTETVAGSAADKATDFYFTKTGRYLAAKQRRQYRGHQHDGRKNKNPEKFPKFPCRHCGARIKLRVLFEGDILGQCGLCGQKYVEFHYGV